MGRAITVLNVVRWHRGRIEYRTRRSWRPSRALRLCCRLGLHFLARDWIRDGFYCECGRQYLLDEQIFPNRPSNLR